MADIGGHHPLAGIAEIAVTGAGHAQRIKDFLLQELAHRHAGGNLDHAGHQLVPKAVKPVRGRIKTYGHLSHGADIIPQGVVANGGGQLVAHLLHHAVGVVLPAVADAHGHGETVPHLNRPGHRTNDVGAVRLFHSHLGVAPLGEILIDRIVKQELTPLVEHHGRGADDHLRAGKLPIDRIRSDGNLLFQVGISEVALIELFAILRHGAAAAGGAVLHMA